MASSAVAGWRVQWLADGEADVGAGEPAGQNSARNTSHSASSGSLQSPFILLTIMCLPSRVPIAQVYAPLMAPPMPQTVRPHGSSCEKTPRPYLALNFGIQPDPSVETVVNISRCWAGLSNWPFSSAPTNRWRSPAVETTPPAAQA